MKQRHSLSPVVLAATALVLTVRVSFAAQPNVIPNGPVTTVEGDTVVQPSQGIEGPDNTSNWCAYNVPGQASEPHCSSTDPGFGQKYDVAYSTQAQPVQSSDWWVSLGVQWQGWVTGLNPQNPVPGTPGIISEPFLARFIDLPDQQQVAGLDLPVQGLSLWNQNDMVVYTGAVTDINGVSHFVNDNPATFGIQRGNIADPRSPVVTVGLAGVHPLGAFTALQTRTAPPWTNIQVQHYSDWGVEFTYTGQGNQLHFTMANGSPFTWAERTQGSAPFRVWAGVAAGNVASTGQQGGVTVWYNQGGVLGLTVRVAWVPNLPPFQPNNATVDCPNDLNADGPNKGKCNAPRVLMTAAYVVYADQGAWGVQQSSDPNTPMVLFANDQASKVVVLALPHSIDPTDAAALTTALQDFQPYAWQRIVDTRIHYPPISGSKTSVTIAGAVKPLGYDQQNSVVRSLMEVTTEDFLTGGAGGAALQLVFPHHRKAMVSADLQNIPLLNGAPKYTWRSLKGELHAYQGNSYMRELRTLGVLPFLPSVAINSTAPTAAVDIYDALKLWFFGQVNPTTFARTGEPQPAPNASAAFAAAGGIGTHAPGANNTYLPNTAALTEGVVIADQLARSGNLAAVDTVWGSPPVGQPVGGGIQQPFPPEKTAPDPAKTKAAVAGEMRDFVLQSLKEVFGKWADIYTGQWFQYNPEFDTIYGFPEGFKSVQNLADHHFHYGYFLRAAAAIGRYDKGWLQAYLPFFEQLRGDIATYNRQDSRYPLLRNFSPFYGHSWADGVANGGSGNNQESVGEALNFAVGLLELGQLLGNTEWRDLGLYLYEEEVLALEQYWFNQDADLTLPSATFYNGNWPERFVRYADKNGTPRFNAVIGRIIQDQTTRSTFFDNVASVSPPYANAYIIQMLPLGGSHLHIGRNLPWLTNAWAQFTAEATATPGITSYEVLVAGLQARLPGSGTGVLDPGPNGALTRINREHPAYPGAINAQGKQWTYALAALGQVDAGVVADTPSYGAFCRGGTGSGCQGGARTYVAYNAATSPITVTFRDGVTGAVVTSLNVPGAAMATVVGTGTPLIDRLTPPVTDATRLYLGKPTTQLVNCGPDTAPQVLPLSRQPGVWLPPVAAFPFPSDSSQLDVSLVCVPPRPTPNPPVGDDAPPAPAYVRTWQGTFSGTRNADQLTRFAVYANQALVPGWQQGVCVAGGAGLPASCPNHTIPGPKNSYILQVRYDFDDDGQYERVEQYRIVSPDTTNTFTHDGKMTEYRADVLMPFHGDAPMELRCPRGEQLCGFPTSIAADQPARVAMDLWGFISPVGPAGEFPVYVSVNADPLTNRASWIRPPYSVRFGGLSCATNVTSQITVTRGGYRRDSTTGRYVQQLTLQNGGSTAIQGPVSLVLDTLSSNATPFGAADTTSCATPASPYVSVNVGTDNVLSPSESATVVLEFTNPTNASITYDTRVLAGRNAR